MARKSLAASALGLILSALAGCGTMVNATSARMPFGGVAVDGCIAVYGVKTTCGLCEKDPELPGPPGSLLLGGLAVLDLPFSLVADITTLPLVLYHKYLDVHDDESLKE